MSIEKKKASDDTSTQLFGLSFSEGQAAVVLLSVPWEATVSYGHGTSLGPAAILKASQQIDLYDSEILKPYQSGITMREASVEVSSWNEEAKQFAQSKQTDSLQRVNSLSEQLRQTVYQEALSLFEKQKLVGIVGGEHSVALGAIEALGSMYDELGILQIDAHCDLRKEYQGFTFSHASVMYNVLERCEHVKKLVQVGIRDYCEEEHNYIVAEEGRVEVFSDAQLFADSSAGNSWSEQTDRIISSLPKQVWVSFDIDGLDPSLCPNTGTPVPGGLSFNQANYLLRKLATSGRSIVGFDLCEVSPPLAGGSEWDANVGMRLLYKLCGWSMLSNGLTSIQKTSF